MAHTCVIVRTSVARRVPRMTSFEMGLSKTVPGGTSVLVLHPSPSIGGWIMHHLPGMEFINDMTWA